MDMKLDNQALPPMMEFDSTKFFINEETQNSNEEFQELYPEKNHQITCINSQDLKYLLLLYENQQDSQYQESSKNELYPERGD